MKRIVIIGAGMAARAAYRLINGSYFNIVAFADNDTSKRGVFCGRPVVSVEEAVTMGADVALVAITGEDRTKQVEAQLLSLGFAGEIKLLSDYRKEIDIRAGAFELIAAQIDERDVQGEIAELGVYKGEFARLLNARFPKRRLYLFDTFEGFDSRDLKTEVKHSFSRASEGDFADTSEEAVTESLPFGEMAVIKKGYFPETAVNLPEKFALVSIDADLYAPTYAGLCVFYPLLSVGGVIIVHDYNSARFKGAGEAARRFFWENNLYPLPLPDLHGTAVVIKQG